MDQAFISLLIIGFYYMVYRETQRDSKRWKENYDKEQKKREEREL